MTKINQANHVNFNTLIQKEEVNEYLGSERKKTVIINDQRYLLKLPDPTRDQHKSLSYISNALSEYLGCKIFQIAGLPVQEVILGTYTNQNGITKTVCACKDLRDKNESLITMEAVANSTFEDEPEKTQTNSFSNLANLAAHIPLPYEQIQDFYYQMFIIDALIGNTDRHYGNWGLLKNNVTDKYRLSPVFDCGSSLAPLLDDDHLSKQALKEAVHNVFSAITDDNGKRLNYKNYFLTSNDSVFARNLSQLIPQFSITTVMDLIATIPYISDTRREFYHELLWQKYELFIIPTFARLVNAAIDNAYITQISDVYTTSALKAKQQELYSTWQPRPLDVSYQLDHNITAKKLTDKIVLLQKADRLGAVTISKTFANIKHWLAVEKYVSGE